MAIRPIAAEAPWLLRIGIAVVWWFREDFERNGTTLPAFVSRYLHQPDTASLSVSTARIEFLDDDWSLNGR